MINEVLLIDDNRADNFLHKMVVKKADVANKITTMLSAEEALKYIQTKNEGGQFPQPELIFLDINMPAMDGWDFIEEFEKLNEDIISKSKVVMITTSLNPDDRAKAQTISRIADFKNKPLTNALLISVLKELSLV